MLNIKTARFSGNFRTGEKCSGKFFRCFSPDVNYILTAIHSRKSLSSFFYAISIRYDLLIHLWKNYFSFCFRHVEIYYFEQKCTFFRFLYVHRLEVKFRRFFANILLISHASLFIPRIFWYFRKTTLFSKHITIMYYEWFQLKKLLFIRKYNTMYSMFIIHSHFIVDDPYHPSNKLLTINMIFRKYQNAYKTSCKFA